MPKSKSFYNLYLLILGLKYFFYNKIVRKKKKPNNN